MDYDKERYEDVPKDHRTIHKNTIKYFRECEDTSVHPTFSGLYIALSINRTTYKKIVNMLEYSTFQEVEEATGISRLTLKEIQAAFYKVVDSCEKRLGGKGQYGAQFELETNADWYKASGVQKEKDQPITVNILNYQEKKKKSKLIPKIEAKDEG